MKEINENVILFEKNEDILLKVAKDKENAGDLEGALNIYLEIERMDKFEVSLYRKIANIYTSLQAYHESIDYWFKFLNFASSRHYAEAYNALGGNFYLLGDMELSAYYFNLQISDEEDDEYQFDEYLYELFSSVSEQNSNIKLVDVQGDKDKENLKLARSIFEKEPKKAYDIANSVEKDSSQYDDACITLAAFYVVEGKIQNAIEKYKEISESSEYYQNALNNLLGAYYFINDIDSANETAKKLTSMQLADFNQLVKFFHLFNSMNKPEVAFLFADCLSKIFTTPRLYFYQGVACYNLQKYKEAEKFFLSYYNVTGYYVAKYHAETANAKLQGKKGGVQFLNYTLFLPVSEVNKLEKNATVLLTQTATQLKRKKDKILQFADACFYTHSKELQIIACQLLSFIGGKKAEKFLKNLLLKHRLSDHLKTVIVTVLVEMENDKLTGMVYGNVYSRIPFEKTQFSEDSSGLFLSAYALAFGRMSPYDEEELYKLQISAYELYYSLLANGNLRKVNDVVALAAFIVINAEIENNLTPEELIEYVGSSVKNVNKIIKLVTQE